MHPVVTESRVASLTSGKGASGGQSTASTAMGSVWLRPRATTTEYFSMHTFVLSADVWPLVASMLYWALMV